MLLLLLLLLQLLLLLLLFAVAVAAAAVSQTLVPNGQPVLVILLSPKGTNVNTNAIMSQLMSN